MKDLQDGVKCRLGIAVLVKQSGIGLVSGHVMILQSEEGHADNVALPSALRIQRLKV